MATNTTFASLLGDIRSYIERGFTADSDPLVYNQLPRLVNMSERKLARHFKILGTQESATSTMAIGVCVYQKPDRWRQTISINYGTGPANEQRKFLKGRSLEFSRRYWPNQTLVAPPLYYSDYNYDHWLILPTPDIAYPFEVMYYQLPPLLDETNTTNWVTEYAPDALLYGALLEAEPFIRNDARMALWKAQYDDALNAIKAEDMKRIIDRTSTRTGS